MAGKGHLLYLILLHFLNKNYYPATNYILSYYLPLYIA